MTENTKRHPFLDDLAEDVVLISSVLRKPIAGKDLALKVVKAGSGQYLDQRPVSLQQFGDRTYFEYEVDLAGDQKAEGLVSVLKDASGKVVRLNITFSPLTAVLAIASGIREQLTGELNEDIFF